MEILAEVLKYLLSALLAFSGAAKLGAIDLTARTVQGFGISGKIARFVGVAVAILELGVGFALFADLAFSRTSAAGLMLVFLVLVSLDFVRNKHTDCYCFGSLFRKQIDGRTVIRNLLLFGFSIIVVLNRPETAMIGIPDDLAKDAFAFGAFALASFAASKAFELGVLQREVEERISAFESLGSIASEDAVSAGLLIGAPIPNLLVSDNDGKSFDLRNLVAKNLATLVVFVESGCTLCSELTKEIIEWRKLAKADLGLIVISKGSFEATLRKMGGEVKDFLLIANEGDALEKFGGKWVPSAVVVSANGRVGGRLATGIDEIVELGENLLEARGEEEMGIELRLSPICDRFGESVPEFDLEYGSRRLTNRDLAARENYIIFWNPECEFCEEICDELPEWRSRIEKAEIFLFTDKPLPAAYAERLGAYVIDPGFGISNLIGKSGTPSAVVISAKGRVASETARGAREIRHLLGVA
ncbi:MAG: hypothetical protein R2684_05450 [Pyrinomonadaceae bacterium]